ncbi:UDP-N-acetylmuramoyl-tripeptide--D-alanyl-D-alanine ligase [Candidatus Nomurabacteria bacterium]|nr:UDP-N-acetylmuramoyl-tripeptide--D-alanyl-D-alanine ligase [Candidatus Nomurabacteria bacterium]
MKKYLKAIIVKLLWLQVDRLRRRHNPTVIAVAGSIGKTGTKTAIATVLSQDKKVRWQDGNYNDIVSVPLIFFGQAMPSLLNPIGWIKVLVSNEAQILGKYTPEIVVLEVGTDYDGNMDEFVARLHADYGVLTAISAEHMANFESMDAVAKEELKIADMVDEIIINADQIDKQYIKVIKDAITYGEGDYDCSINPSKLTKDFYRPVSFILNGKADAISIKTRLIGRQNLPGLASAVILGEKLGLSNSDIKSGLEKVQPIAGRMQLLLGKKQSLLIDDSYNASPEAVIAALNTLYEIPSRNRIAVLGQMNELGKFSESMHKKVGQECDPSKLELLVTIGDDANNYLADSAEKAGCKVLRCPSPYHAADIVSSLLKKGSVVLIKGSQNGVFSEEVTKKLLQNKKDQQRLVRQSKAWLKAKERQFGIND